MKVDTVKHGLSVVDRYKLCYMEACDSVQSFRFFDLFITKKYETCLCGSAVMMRHVGGPVGAKIRYNFH